MPSRSPNRGLVALCALALSAQASAADFIDLDMGRYMAKYPALYSTLSLSDSPRDEIFDAQGQRQHSAAPTYGDGNAFAQQRLSIKFEWQFPLLETEALPFVSSRLWTARATLGYEKLKTSGPITDFIAANNLSSKGDGLSDLQLEFGPLLLGSEHWRTRTETPYSLMLLGQVMVPVGQRDSDAPNNAGLANAPGFGAKLGGHWRPFPRIYVDAGANWRHTLRNEEPAFGAQEPRARGDERLYDLSVNARLWSGIYAGFAYLRRDTAADTYERLRFASNPPSTPVGTETMPDPSAIRDGGVAEQSVGATLQWFMTPRVSLAARWLHPVSGKSGEFDLPYTRQAIDCAATASCSPQPNGSAHVDGLGAARAWASDTWMLALSWNYGQGDFWGTGQ